MVTLVDLAGSERAKETGAKESAFKRETTSTRVS